MKRDQRFGIRVSQEELNYYKQCANRCNISVADWARNRLNENRSYSENAPVLAEIITRMQTDINKAVNNIDLDKCLNNLLCEVNELWRFLKR